jgi:thiol-disulfide isomerase/thioredoxin
MRQRLRARSVVAAIVIAVAVTGCVSGRDAVAQGGTFEFVSPGGKTDIFYDPPGSRGTIGDVSGPALMGGQPIHLSDFGGKVVVINIWGSWCGPCRRNPGIGGGVRHDPAARCAVPRHRCAR